MQKNNTYALACLIWALTAVAPATGQHADSTGKVTPKAYKPLDIFPAISYAPETKLTLGAIGIAYFDLSKGTGSAPISNLEFLGVYTLNKQLVFETRWEFFTKNSTWRSRGEAFFNRYPDRNYGLGNDASVLVAEVDASGVRDTFNYLNYNSDRIKFSPVVLRKLQPSLYLGLQYDMEYLFNLKPIPERYEFISADSAAIQDMPVAGFRSGLGFQLLFDTRDQVLNPLKGSLIALNYLNYGRWLGSDYQFNRISVEARHYLNTFKNQTVAFRAVGTLMFTEDQIPMRALQQVGGHKFIRGYFRGTYQDRHILAFEAEYRLPFWPEGTQAKLWQVWKRLGLVGFIGGAQVMHEPSDFRFDRFNLAVGGGLRILFNPKSRVNLRIDYAFALRADSDGPGKRQSGFYFFLGEAF